MKKLSKLLLMMLITAFTFTGVHTITSNAASGLVYHGKYPIPGATHGVGYFTYNGEQVFCIEHRQLSPSTGDTVNEQVYNNPAIKKVLYYGYKGEKQYPHFSGHQQGTIFTSLLLSETYHPSEVGDYDYIAGYKAFKNWVKSKPVPVHTTVKFNKTSVQAYYDKTIEKQRTEEISVIGGAGGKVTFTLPANVTLVKSDNTKLTGTVTLTVGDKFHLEAGIDAVDGTYSTGTVGQSKKFQPILFKNPKAGFQDLAKMKKIEDPTGSTKLDVKWSDYVLVSKKEITNNTELAGAKMQVINPDDGSVVHEWTSTNEPHKVGGLTEGKKYILREVLAPKGYYKAQDVEFLVGKGITKVEMKNDFTNTEVSKTSSTTGKELPGAKLQIIDPETGKVIEEWTSTEETHKVKGLTEGKEYILKEIIAPKGYYLAQDVKFTVGANTKVHMVDKVKEGRVVVKGFGGNVKTGVANDMPLYAVTMITALLLLFAVPVYRKVRAR